MAYERRVLDIIDKLKGNPTREYYVAAFPFFNTNNSLMYDLVHCTSHLKGFELFKTTAWKTFDGQSSSKNRHGEEYQMVLDFTGNTLCTTRVDKYCYNIRDIATYLQKQFRGQEVSLDDVWALLNNHPLFPADGFRTQIKSELKKNYGARESKNAATRRTTIPFKG